jgi:hypothetical protein
MCAAGASRLENKDHNMPSAPKQVRWEAQPHTLAKIQILKTYLHAWFQIMGRSQRGKDLPI